MADLTKARRELRRLYGVVHRSEKGVTTGRNALSTRAAARAAFECSLQEVVAIEDALGDAHGDAAAWKVSDRLTDLTQRAMAQGLLSPADVMDIERRVLG